MFDVEKEKTCCLAISTLPIGIPLGEKRCSLVRSMCQAPRLEGRQLLDAALLANDLDKLFALISFHCRRIFLFLCLIYSYVFLTNFRKEESMCVE